MVKLWSDRFKPHKPFLQVLRERSAAGVQEGSPALGGTERFHIYEQRKQSFLALNNPTADEYEAFCRALAKELGI